MFKKLATAFCLAVPLAACGLSPEVEAQRDAEHEQKMQDYEEYESFGPEGTLDSVYFIDNFKIYEFTPAANPEKTCVMRPFGNSPPFCFDKG